MPKGKAVVAPGASFDYVTIKMLVVAIFRSASNLVFPHVVKAKDRMR